jgi:hypothetical protein
MAGRLFALSQRAEAEATEKQLPVIGGQLLVKARKQL